MLIKIKNLVLLYLIHGDLQGGESVGGQAVVCDAALPFGSSFEVLKTYTCNPLKNTLGISLPT
jgi:hypothetical protein